VAILMLFFVSLKVLDLLKVARHAIKKKWF